MPKSATYIHILLLALCLPFLSRAQSSPPPNAEAVVDSLINKMALEYQIGEAPEEIRLQFEQNPLPIADETNAKMLSLFDEAYATEPLLEDFASALEKEFSGQYANQIQNWLNAPSTQIVTSARQEFYTLQGKRKRIITMHEMEANPPSDKRQQLISTLTDTTTVAESSVESSIIVLRSVIKALGELSDRQSFTEMQINTIANNFRGQMQAQAGQQLNDQSMVMYHGVPDDTLEDYISFWGTETGQWLDRAISQSMQTAYSRAADRFLQTVKTSE